MDKMEVKFVAGSEAPKPVQYNRLPGALVTSRTVGPFALRLRFARVALPFAQPLGGQVAQVGRKHCGKRRSAAGRARDGISPGVAASGLEG